MKKTRSVYEATARRSDDWWVLDVDGVSGAHTQSRRLDKAEAAISEVLSLLLNVSPTSFDVIVRPVLSAREEKALRDIVTARERLEAATAVISERQSQAARLLVTDEGLSYRDTAILMGLSHQRVAQLL